MNIRVIKIVAVAALIGTVALVWWASDSLGSRSGATRRSPPRSTNGWQESRQSVSNQIARQPPGVTKLLTVAALSEIPPAIREYLTSTNTDHPWDVPPFTGQSLEELLQRLAQSEIPAEAYRLARVLSHTPENLVFHALAHKLTNGFIGRALNIYEIGSVANIASMGWLAGRLDSAYEFAKKGASVNFWRTNHRWTAPGNEELALRLLANRCWISLAESQRPEAYQYLLEIREGRHPLTYPAMSDHVAEAAMRYHIAQDVILLGPSHFMELSRRWTCETSEGKKWSDWAAEHKAR